MPAVESAALFRRVCVQPCRRRACAEFIGSRTGCAMGDVRSSDHAVVIPGGGPTGLMLAGELALAGVDAIIV